MTAYLIAENLSVSDPELYSAYGKAAGPTVRAHGGKVLGSGAAEVLEGDWAPKQMIVIAFESADKLRAWYNSPEYQEILPMRLKASKSNVVFLGD